MKPWVRWARYGGLVLGMYLVIIFVWYWAVVYAFETYVNPAALRNGEEWARGAKYPAEECTLVVLGDSTAYGAGASDLDNSMAIAAWRLLSGWGSAMEQCLDNQSVIGARLADVVDQQLPTVQGKQFKYMLIAVGANDATHLTSLADYRRDLERLFSFLRPGPPKTVFMLTAPDMGVVLGVPPGLNLIVQQRCLAQNAILKELAPPSVVIVDIYEHGKLDGYRHGEYYAADFFHPSDEGYRIWNRLIVQAIVEARQ